MQKYSFKTKLEIVKIYNRGEAGMKHLAKLYGTNKVNVKTWIHAYNNLGIKGLRPLKKSPTYSFEFKKNIVTVSYTHSPSPRDVEESRMPSSA